MFRKITFYFILIGCLSVYSHAQDKPVNERQTVKKTKKKSMSLKIISRPQPSYTAEARNNNVQGIVRLQVTFLKDGTIGNIKILTPLPDGLTNQAVRAAEKIKFEPEIKFGKPQTVTKTVAYTFTIY